jgi:hypothetical protein
MAVTYLGNSQWSGLSTDTKPTGIATGSSFRETDLNHTKFYDGTFWRVSRFGLPSSRKIGFWTGLGTTGDGILTSPVTAGTLSGVVDSTAGRGAQYATGTSAGTWAGIRGSTQSIIRAYNPIFRLKFRLDQTNSGNVMRYFAGFATNTAVIPNTDDPLSGIFGVGLQINSTDTTFKIGHNDGGGAGLAAQTNITGTPAIDTSVHTIEIAADNANTRFGVSWDGGAYQFISSDIPFSTSALNVHAAIYNVTTTDVSHDIFYGELESDI